MSSIPKALFIQQSDEGTDMLFLTQVGIYASPSKSEAEWQVEKRFHLSKEDAVNITNILSYVVQASTPSEEVDPEALWFVQHVQDLS